MNTDTRAAQPANTENHYRVTRADLPLSCPMPGMALWNSHPRVYLPLEEGGSAACPYCGAEFELVEDDRANAPSGGRHV